MTSATDSPGALLSFRGVTRGFRVGRDWVNVLDDVSFDVGHGEFVVLHGERRSGKSTLLRVAAGWEKSNAGTVIYDGKDVTRMSRGERAKLLRRGGMGLTAGMVRPRSNKPAVNHVADALLSDRFSPREAMEPALRALELVGLSDRSHTPSELLSYDELIRLGLAQRLVHKPRLLLVDEPAACLRPSESIEIYELLASLGENLGIALIIASEDLTPIRRARRTMSLDDGRLRIMSTPPGTVVEFPGSRTASGQRP